jgi:LDH2 family malate/lactate/ureidoglycolate dehydrogenase
LGLAYAVDILTGLITGGAFLDGMKGMYKYPNDPSLTGHFMIALNVEAIIGRAEMKARMAHYLASIKASPMWDAEKEMLLPGEIEYRTSLARKRDGIPLPSNLHAELAALGRELGVSNEL